jgi:hypothetical protein
MSSDLENRGHRIRELAALGMSCSDIAREVGRTTAQVRGYMGRHRIMLAPKARDPTKSTRVSDDLLAARDRRLELDAQAASNDVNVLLLGDPGPHRSALASRGRSGPRDVTVRASGPRGAHQ